MLLSFVLTCAIGPICAIFLRNDRLFVIARHLINRVLFLICGCSSDCGAEGREDAYRVIDADHLTIAKYVCTIELLCALVDLLA